MELFCPQCKTKIEELIECENCGVIGCIKCIRRKYGKWVCHKCPQKIEINTSTQEKELQEENSIKNAFSSMFG